MKGKRVFLAAVGLLFLLPGWTCHGQETALPEISAKSAVLITADTGLVLFGRDKDTPRPIASTTKILTALLALEEARRTGDKVVEIPEAAVQAEGSSMGLQPGDRLRLSQLAAGMMMTSGNDAALAIALHVSGSEEDFARLMNQRARELGMSRSHFVTASGLDAPEHQATAYDLALLAREALNDPAFAEIAAASSWPVEYEDVPHTVELRSHNKLLAQVEGCIGVKTGYTRQAGRCLVSAAEREGIRLIAVTLDDPDDWKDHAALLEYGFQAVKKLTFPVPERLTVPTAGEEPACLALTSPQGVSLTVPKGVGGRIETQVFLPRFVLGPIKAGDPLGWVRYTLDGTMLFQLPLQARNDLPGAAKQPGFWEQLLSSWNNP